jgi:hypothetical protein
MKAAFNDFELLQFVGGNMRKYVCNERQKNI